MQTSIPQITLSGKWSWSVVRWVLITLHYVKIEKLSSLKVSKLTNSFDLWHNRTTLESRAWNLPVEVAAHTDIHNLFVSKDTKTCTSTICYEHSCVPKKSILYSLPTPRSNYHQTQSTRQWMPNCQKYTRSWEDWVYLTWFQTCSHRNGRDPARSTRLRTKEVQSPSLFSYPF